MTNKVRRPRTDSMGNLHRILAAADIQLAPPSHVPLQNTDLPYWHSIVDEFAAADWTPHALTIAAFLARTMSSLEAEQRLLLEEGLMIARSDRVPRVNPRHRTVNALASQVLAIRRSLGLTGRAKAGGTRDVVRLREVNRRTERAASRSSVLLA